MSYVSWAKCKVSVKKKEAPSINMPTTTVVVYTLSARIPFIHICTVIPNTSTFGSFCYTVVKRYWPHPMHESGNEEQPTALKGSIRRPT
jgi:hypothetical protein